jgi:thiosulfate oxidation carrier protein SoxY/thiosulfate oxidation carrier complex protein SoxZ
MRPVNSARREFIAMFSVAASLLMLPITVLAAVWNKTAFNAEKLDEAEKVLEINGEIPSSNIKITAPGRAENGAIVQVEIDASIANVEAIAIFVEKNPTPLIANVMLAKGAQAKLVTRIKMAETSDIKVVVKADGKYFTASKNVQVLENGCGGGGSANEKFESSMKLRAKQKGHLTEIKAIIIHPMHTGRAKDDAGNIIPAHFIQIADLMLNGQPVLQMQWGTGIAKNPYLTCFVDNAKVGDTVRLTWHDNLGATATQDIKVT